METAAKKMKRRKPKRALKSRSLLEAVELACPYCGEVSPIPIDEGGGERQSFVDDCSVCCRPRVVHVERNEEGGDRVWLEREGQE